MGPTSHGRARGCLGTTTHHKGDPLFPWQGPNKSIGKRQILRQVSLLIARGAYVAPYAMCAMRDQHDEAGHRL